MNSANGITYESMLTYLKNAEKQINSTLDVNCFYNPFDSQHNYETISDLQIYCDTLLNHLSEELTQLSPFGPNFEAYNHSFNNNNNENQMINGIKNISIYENNDKTEMRRIVGLESIESNSQSAESGSQSPILLTQSVNSLVNSIPSPSNRSDGSNDNTISTTSSDHKCVNHFNNNSYHISYHRLSFYENVDNNRDIEVELLTAQQLHTIRQQLGFHNYRTINALSSTKPALLSSPSTSTLFGCDMDLIQSYTCGLVLPPFIEKSLIFLSQKGINSVGIFRKSGVKSRIMSMREQAEEGIEMNLTDVCVYDIADVTKTWFRELKPKQLLTQQIISLFKENKKEFTLCAIPDAQRAILQIVLRFLGLISNNSNINQMNSHNLAICLTPSLCECDGDQQLFDAQKCLEYCIDHCESLFVISLDLYSIPNGIDSESLLAFKHESTAIIECGPNDILNRILYERNLFDPTITEWSVSEQITSNSDTFIIKLELSAFLPIKSIIVRRSWRINSLNNIEISENGYLYESRWSVATSGEGKTLVAHMIALDLRGHSYDWYSSTFPAIHNLQLYRLAQSFLVNKNNCLKTSNI